MYKHGIMLSCHSIWPQTGRKGSKYDLRLVIEGTVARIEDRYVSVVVLNSNSYGDGRALLHRAEIASPIARNDRREALKHQ